MNVSNGAQASWFGNPGDDRHYLDAWRGAAVTYQDGQPLHGAWHADRYEVLLGFDPSGELFGRAAKLTLRNRFYPLQVMHNTSDFGLAARTVQVGDHVLQRIHILRLGQRALYDVLTLNVITAVVDEARCAGFTYTTTDRHTEIGEWSPRVEWRDDGRVWLVVEVISRMQPRTGFWGRRFGRMLQLRAHRLSLAAFRAQLDGWRHLPAESLLPSASAPAAMLGTALGLGLWFMGRWVVAATDPSRAVIEDR